MAFARAHYWLTLKEVERGVKQQDLSWQLISTFSRRVSPDLDFYLHPVNFASIMNSIINITAQALRKAAGIQERIQSLQHELGQILDGGEIPVPFFRASTGKRKRRMSAASRAKIAAAARARWARIKGRKPSKSRKGKMSAAGLANIRAGVKKRMAKLRGASTSSKPRRKISAAGRARLSAMAKERWKKAKAAGKSAL